MCRLAKAQIGPVNPRTQKRLITTILNCFRQFKLGLPISKLGPELTRDANNCSRLSC